MLVLVSGTGYRRLFSQLLFNYSLTLFICLQVHNSRLNIVEQLSRSLGYDSKELPVICSLIPTYFYPTVPNANYNHNVPNVHLLEDSEKFFARSIFSVVVEALS